MTNRLLVRVSRALRFAQIGKPPPFAQGIPMRAVLEPPPTQNADNRPVLTIAEPEQGLPDAAVTFAAMRRQLTGLTVRTREMLGVLNAILNAAETRHDD